MRRQDAPPAERLVGDRALHGSPQPPRGRPPGRGAHDPCRQLGAWRRRLRRGPTLHRPIARFPETRSAHAHAPVFALCDEARVSCGPPRHGVRPRFAVQGGRRTPRGADQVFGAAADPSDRSHRIRYDHRCAGAARRPDRCVRPTCRPTYHQDRQISDCRRSRQTADLCRRRNPTHLGSPKTHRGASVVVDPETWVSMLRHGP